MINRQIVSLVAFFCAFNPAPAWPQCIIIARRVRASMLENPQTRLFPLLSVLSKIFSSLSKIASYLPNPTVTPFPALPLLPPSTAFFVAEKRGVGPRKKLGITLRRPSLRLVKFFFLVRFCGLAALRLPKTKIVHAHFAISQMTKIDFACGQFRFRIIENHHDIAFPFDFEFCISPQLFCDFVKLILHFRNHFAFSILYC